MSNPQKRKGFNHTTDTEHVCFDTEHVCFGKLKNDQLVEKHPTDETRG
jgi:hypothetical protein